MSISIYELVGLAKNGKAPKKIRYFNKIYEYDEQQEDYAHFYIDHYDYLLDDTNTFSQFSNTVEILEEVEDKEYEDIDVISFCNEEQSELALKINALIRNQKYILEQLNK